MPPFKIDIAQPELDDLKARLAQTRFPDEVEDAGWDYGTSIPFLRRLVEHWSDRFDWRAADARLNGFAQFTTEIDGETIHFVHVRGAGADPTPVLLANGWPSNFVELLPLVPLLIAEQEGASFSVVIPSLPGYGFSGKPKRKGMNLTRIAHLWAKLMTELGTTSSCSRAPTSAPALGSGWCGTIPSGCWGRIGSTSFRSIRGRTSRPRRSRITSRRSTIGALPRPAM